MAEAGEKKKKTLHFPDSLAAKVLDLICVSPKRIPHGDLNLGTKLNGREADLRTSICWHRE